MGLVWRLKETVCPQMCDFFLTGKRFFFFHFLQKSDSPLIPLVGDTGLPSKVEKHIEIEACSMVVYSLFGI